jgi:hypothetical protein
VGKFHIRMGSCKTSQALDTMKSSCPSTYTSFWYCTFAFKSPLSIITIVPYGRFLVPCFFIMFFYFHDDCLMLWVSSSLIISARASAHARKKMMFLGLNVKIPLSKLPS